MNFLLSYYCQFFLVHLTVKNKKKRKQDCFFVVLVFSCFPVGVHVLVGKLEATVISKIDQMEHLGGEQHSQYEGNLSALRSMRDYRNSPWMNVPLFMVPPTNIPYGNFYKPSWRNNLNLSWGPEPSQYAPPASPSYASTPQSQPP